MSQYRLCLVVAGMLVASPAVLAQDKPAEPAPTSNFFVVEVPKDTSGLSPEVAKLLASDKARKLDEVVLGPYFPDKLGPKAIITSQSTNIIGQGNYETPWPDSWSKGKGMTNVESGDVSMIFVTLTLEDVKEIIDLCQATAGQSVRMVCKKLGIQP